MSSESRESLEHSIAFKRGNILRDKVDALTTAQFLFIAFFIARYLAVGAEHARTPGGQIAFELGSAAAAAATVCVYKLIEDELRSGNDDKGALTMYEVDLVEEQVVGAAEEVCDAEELDLLMWESRLEDQ